MQRDGFDSQFPAFGCFVAELQDTDQSRLIGYAVYCPIYSTWQGKSMMLQELYVKTAERLRGVGHRLFNAVAKVRMYVYILILAIQSKIRATSSFTIKT